MDPIVPRRESAAHAVPIARAISTADAAVAAWGTPAPCRVDALP